MTDIQTQIRWLLCTMPMLYGLIGGQLPPIDSSCIPSTLMERPTPLTREYETDPTVLARGYRMVPHEDLKYSMQLLERLWKYFVDEGEHFSPEQAEVIDKEFWNLG